MKLTLSRQLDAATVESDLRSEFPDLKIKTGITGAIKLYPRFDIVVVIRVGAGKLNLYATFPLVYALLAGGSRSGGYSDDEKRAEEKRYMAWLRQKYAAYVYEV